MCICDCLSRCWNSCRGRTAVKSTGHRPASATIADVDSRLTQAAQSTLPQGSMPPPARANLRVNQWNGRAGLGSAASPTSAHPSSQPSSSRGTQGRGSVLSMSPQAASTSHGVQPAGDLSHRVARVDAAAANTLSPPPARSFTYRLNAGPAPSGASSTALVNDGTRSMMPPSSAPTLRTLPPGVVLENPNAKNFPNEVLAVPQSGGVGASNQAVGVAGGSQVSLRHEPVLVPQSPPSVVRECDSQQQAKASAAAMNPTEGYHVGHAANAANAENLQVPVFLIGISVDDVQSSAQGGAASSGPPPSNAAEPDGVKTPGGEDRLALLWQKDVTVNMVGFPPFPSNPLDAGAGAQSGSGSKSTSSTLRRLSKDATDAGAAGVAGNGIPYDAAVSNPSPREPHAGGDPVVGNVRDLPIGGEGGARACAPIAEEEASAPVSGQGSSPPSKMSHVFSRNTNGNPPDP